MSACDALRHVINRRSNIAQSADEADEADIIKGLTVAANALSSAAERVTSNPNQQDLISDPEEVMFIKRLAETMLTMASYHLSTITDENVRNTFLERMLGLTRFANLEVLDVIINAWPVLLRAMGAELPKTFTRGPPSQGADNPYNAPKVEPNGILPSGASEALLDIGKWWINAGAGIASGFDSSGIPGNRVDDWRDEFESALELRETWVQLRAKWMDVVKLCTALCPTNAANQAAQNTFTVLSWTQPGGPLATASDEKRCAALEGASSFLEAVMVALPTEGPSFEGFASTLETLLSQLVTIDFKTPHSNAQVAKLLETYGKFSRTRPDAARTIMSRLFTILNELPADLTAGAPPVRQRDIIASGRSGQAARQKVCAAILVVCSAAPMVRSFMYDASVACVCVCVYRVSPCKRSLENTPSSFSLDVFYAGARQRHANATRASAPLGVDGASRIRDIFSLARIASTARDDVCTDQSRFSSPRRTHRRSIRCYKTLRDKLKP